MLSLEHADRVNRGASIVSFSLLTSELLIGMAMPIEARTPGDFRPHGRN